MCGTVKKKVNLWDCLRCAYVGVSEEKTNDIFVEFWIKQ